MIQKIIVKDVSKQVDYKFNDGKLTCAHRNVQVDPPCCYSRNSDGLVECACRGVHSVYCPDCDNQQLTDDDMDRVMVNYHENKSLAEEG